MIINTQSVQRTIDLQGAIQYPLSMVSEVVAKILGISFDEEEGGYIVQFWVGQELNHLATIGDAFKVLGQMDALQRKVYTFLVKWEKGECIMEPDEALAECLSIFDQYETIDDLGSDIGKKWKTGQVSEAIVAHLANANTFGIWRTSSEEVEGPNLTMNTETVFENEGLNSDLEDGLDLEPSSLKK